MLFASFDFLLFIVPVLGVYWYLRTRGVARWAWLLASSYFFYMASGESVDGPPPPAWYYVGLIFGSTLLDYGCALGLQAMRGGDLLFVTRKKSYVVPPQILLWASIAGNLGLLGYFKYTNFLLTAGSDLAQALGIDWAAPSLQLVLPIGISFYTFQSLSYTIDVWRREIDAERNFFRFATFVACFPQLVAGPIVRARELLPQLGPTPRLDPQTTRLALFRIWKGLLKKIVLGDLIGSHLVDPVFANPHNYSSLEILVALYAFTLQIYADFSGYCDIAIGVAALMGLKIPENFARPHQSRNVGEFWRSWHMTLSTWLRDYVYFPLGGSRRGPLRSYFNLWLTMMLVGMWHGASWTFVIYAHVQAMAMVIYRWRSKAEKTTSSVGAIFAGPHFWVGAVLVVAAALVPIELSGALSTSATLVLVALLFGVHVIIALLPQLPGHWCTAGHIALTFQFTVLSRIFFRAEDFESAIAIVEKLCHFESVGIRQGWFRLRPLADLSWAPEILREFGALYILVLGLAYHFTPRHWVDEYLAGWVCRLRPIGIGLLLAITCGLCMHLLDGPHANIYFDF